MKKYYFIVLLIGFFCVGKHTLAQTIIIPDANFRAYLVAQHPTVMNVSQQLIVANAKALNATISCQNLNITNLSGLEYFYKATMINCSGNLVGVIPSLDSMKVLQHFWAIGCGLTQVPNVNHITSLQTLDLKSNNLTALPSLSGLSNLTYFDCSQNQLTSIPSTSTLVALKTFYCYSNQLTQLPDLTNNVALERLDCPSNQLTALPNLSILVNLKFLNCSYNNLTTLPSLTNLTNLEELLVGKNLLTQLPSLISTTFLKKVDVSNNRLTSFPDLSGYSGLTWVNLANNQLSFSSILPQASHPSFATIFQVAPQDSLLNYPSKTLVRNSIGNLDCGVDASVSGNKFVWYKNGQPTSVTSAQFVFSPPQLSDTGTYVCVLQNSNPLLSGVQINVRAFKLSVGGCLSSTASYSYTIDSITCMDGALLTIDESDLISSYKPFHYQLIPMQGQKAYAGMTNQMKGIQPGKYTLVVKDANACSQKFNEPIYVSYPKDCDNIITPNGDGIDDTYFIDKTGTVKVFTKTNALIKEFSIPGNWDGTDSKGMVVALGYYILVVNGKEKVGVIVLD